MMTASRRAPYVSARGVRAFRPGAERSRPTQAPVRGGVVRREISYLLLHAGGTGCYSLVTADATVNDSVKLTTMLPAVTPSGLRLRDMPSNSRPGGMMSEDGASAF